MTVESAGHSDGNYARGFVNGELIGEPSDYIRGVNVAIVDPVSGVVDGEGFDTDSDPTACSSLENWFMDKIANGLVAKHIALATVKDSAAQHWDSDCTNMMKMMGWSGDDPPTTRSSWAFIG